MKRQRWYGLTNDASVKAWGNSSKSQPPHPTTDTKLIRAAKRRRDQNFAYGQDAIFHRMPLYIGGNDAELVVSVEAGASKLIRLYAVLKARINRRS